MRKQVVRIFLGFALVIAVFLAIQASTFLFSVHQQRRAWVDSVFDEYLESFTTRLKADLADTSRETFTVEETLLFSLNDRISGLYLRNPAGSAVVAWGATASGDQLPLPPGLKQNRPRVFEGQLVPAEEEAGFTSKTMRCDLYEVAITSVGSLYTIEVSKRQRSFWQKIMLPPQVKATDIAGSLTITYNGESLGSVDVLTYTPDTYKGTYKLFGGLLSSFLLSLPIALIIALIMAATLSRHSQRYTDAIQRALSTLADGEGEIALPKTKIEEQKIINEAIENLDRTLQQNTQSRQAWLRAISHDLNTPVTAMKLVIDGMVDGIFPLTDETIGQLQKENDQLALKIAAVSLYATLQSPEARAQTEALDIEQFIKSSLEAIPEGERERIYIDRTDADLNADPLLLTHAARELLKNALSASSSPVGWKIAKNELIFTNEGTIDPQIDFFEPWSRGDSSRHEPGTGLGLPIVYQVMRLHEGSATIEQKDGSVIVTLRW